MKDDPNQTASTPRTGFADSAIRPGEVAITLPEAADAGVYFIGTIRTPWHRRGDCPKRGSPDGPVCTIVVDERWRAALTDVAQHKRMQVLYWMHRSRRDLVLQTPLSTWPDHWQFRIALAGAAEPDRIICGRCGGGRWRNAAGARP